MIVAGRVSQKMAPVAAPDLRPDARAQVGASRWASAPARGGMFNNYAIVQGVDHVVPVDMYLPGCPPRPEMLIDAILKLHEQIQARQARRQPRAPQIERAEAAALAALPTSRDEGPAAMSRRDAADAGRHGEDARAAAARATSPDGRRRRRRAVEAEVVGVRTRHVRRARHRRHLRLRRAGHARSRCPAPPSGPYGGWFDEVADALERARSPTAAPAYDERRRAGRRRPRRDHLPRRAASTCSPSRARCATTPTLRFELCTGVTGVHYPDDDRPRAARGLPPALDDPQPPGPRSRSPAPTPTRTSRRSSRSTRPTTGTSARPGTCSGSSSTATRR